MATRLYAKRSQLDAGRRVCVVSITNSARKQISKMLNGSIKVLFKGLIKWAIFITSIMTVKVIHHAKIKLLLRREDLLL